MATIIRTENSQLLIGSLGVCNWKQIYDLAGDDTINGLENGDLINGNQGNDILDRSAGEDTLRGAKESDNAGEDTLRGAKESDNLSGDLGSDNI